MNCKIHGTEFTVFPNDVLLCIKCEQTINELSNTDNKLDQILNRVSTIARKIR